MRFTTLHDYFVLAITQRLALALYDISETILIITAFMRGSDVWISFARWLDRRLGSLALPLKSSFQG